MKDKEDNSGNEGMESRILACAERLFLNKGYNLTSMTEIAKEAGCTQALVHYYFRTKENLFSKIFEGKFQQFIDCIVKQEDESLPFGKLIEVRTSRLFDLMAANERLPFMFLSEFIINPDQRINLKDNIVSLCTEATSRLEAKIREEMESGRIRSTCTMDITLNMFSLVVTFFVVLPFLEEVGLVTDANREEFIAGRKQEIIRTIIASLRP
ncbi:MAG TPA: TetR/AcrR family transcriptional regulator [Candidatus Coprenecus stercoravium]|uniref:TetR/AcrR family transcriptional regulator n=1 Tax=Candidatus Coprenecus stercoravium TaxID=2840735 RepID=A0A9D2GRL1_9BACT|nr:TetR/AcrR family transcriptional regulator [Candidatus Coprenecus stercoravium]